MQKYPLKLSCLFFIAGLLLMLAGCSGYMEYLNRSPRPTDNNTNLMTRYTSSDYDVLGVVEAEGESRCLVGIIVEGTEGEGLLWKKAKEEYGKRVTGIKDIGKWYEYEGILSPIFSEIKTTYIGTAVHER